MTGEMDSTHRIPVDGVVLAGDLAVPDDATGLVVFAHGSGSSRLSPRNNQVAATVRDHGLGTLLFDLLTETEDEVRENRFDIPLLTDRLVAATAWVREQSESAGLDVGFFGSSTGAAAALKAAARLGDDAGAVVSRGGRVDLAGDDLSSVTAPSMFIVGERDEQVLAWNRDTIELLAGPHELVVVPNAGHLFEEPGALETVSAAAAEWFTTHLGHS